MTPRIKTKVKRPKCRTRCDYCGSRREPKFLYWHEYCDCKKKVGVWLCEDGVECICRFAKKFLKDTE